MTDINPDVPDKPIVVSDTAVGTQVGTGTRDVLLIAAALPALVAILGTRDVNKIVAYIGSTEFAPTLGVLVGIATLGYRQWKARKKHSNEMRLVNRVPDAVGRVERPWWAFWR